MKVGAKTLFIEPGSPWENGYIKSFNGKFGDELLAREQFDTLREARVFVERWRVHYNTVRFTVRWAIAPPFRNRSSHVRTFWLRLHERV